jgi:hypothetical protein
MKLTFKIIEQDFIDFQLFSASQSDRIKKKLRNGWVLLTVGAVVLSVYFYFNGDLKSTIYFGLIALLCGLFYPKYFVWRYKKHFKNHIKENYSKRFDEVETIEFQSESISYADRIGEGSIKISEVEEVNETDKHLFIKLSIGHSLIIPKRDIDELDKLTDKIKSLGIDIKKVVNNNWK